MGQVEETQWEKWTDYEEIGRFNDKWKREEDLFYMYYIFYCKFSGPKPYHLPYLQKLVIISFIIYCSKGWVGTVEFSTTDGSHRPCTSNIRNQETNGDQILTENKITGL